MGTVTFSGFNNIDWNAVLTAVMAQESQPVTALQTQQTALKSQQTAFSTLATKLSTLQSSLSDLSKATSFGAKAATTSDSTTATIDASASTAAGTYDVVVKELARAQTTAATSTAPDADTTSVASGGSIIINGKTVSVTVPTSLQQLADAINSTDDVGVVASVVSTGPGHYQLVLTGRSTGTASKFTVQNHLTGGASPVTFADADGNGISGDTDSDNAVSATDAVATVNNVTVTSATNTIEDAIPGATITLLKKNPTATVTLSVTQDISATTQMVSSFVTAFNDLTSFAKDQASAAAKGSTDNIGHDALLQGLRRQLREDLSGQYNAGSSNEYLSSIGIQFDQSGMLKFDQATFRDALSSNPTAVQKLVTTAFTTLTADVDSYTSEGGLLPSAQDRLDSQLKSVANRISAMEDRLLIRRNALAKEYQATDTAITALNSSVSTLTSLNNQYRLY